MWANEWLPGGDLDSEETKFRSGGTRKQTARGGKRTRSNVTLSIEATAVVWALRAKLEASIGIEPATAIKQMVDSRDVPVGSPIAVTGVLKSVNFPDYDLSGNEVGYLEIEVSADE